MKIFAVVAIVLLVSTPPVKWGKHKRQSESLAVPDAPFSIEPVADPRDAQVRAYLDKKLGQLHEDQPKYPGLKDQIDALVEDIKILENMPVADPDYPAKFAAFHASLTNLWLLEGDDSI